MCKSNLSNAKRRKFISPQLLTSSTGSTANDNRMCTPMLNNQIVAVLHSPVIYVSTNVGNTVVTLPCLHTKPGQVSGQSVNRIGNSKSMCWLALKILTVLKVVCECHLYLVTHSVNLIVVSVRVCCSYSMMTKWALWKEGYKSRGWTKILPSMFQRNTFSIHALPLFS